jgi:hypothetical protein
VGATNSDKKAPGPDEPTVDSRRHLDETRAWIDGFYVNDSAKARERLLFRGTPDRGAPRGAGLRP